MGKQGKERQGHFQVELESTNSSSGPKKREIFEALISDSHIVVHKSLRGGLFTVCILYGIDRFIGTARVIASAKSRTTLIWLNLMDSDREHLAEILEEKAASEKSEAVPAIVGPNDKQHN